MTGRREGSLDRRHFMAVTIGGLGCLALGGVKEALARAQETGKPVLTDKALNDLIAKTAGDAKAYQKQANAAKGDLYAFLDRNFTLTEEQAYATRYIGAANTEALNKAIDTSTELLAKMSEGDEPVPDGWSPMTVTIAGTATKEATAKISYGYTETEDAEGEATPSDGVTVEVSYQ